MATAFKIFTAAVAEAAEIDGVLGGEQVISPPDPTYDYYCTPRKCLDVRLDGLRRCSLCNPRD
jgi:hypothetical protein